MRLSSRVTVFLYFLSIFFSLCHCTKKKELADSCSHPLPPPGLYGNASWASGLNGEDIPVKLDSGSGGISFLGKAVMAGVFCAAVVTVYARRMRRSASDEKYS